MADTKITALTADTTPTSDDLVPIVDDPSGTPTNKKTTIGNLSKGINLDNVSSGTTNKVYTATEQTKLAGIATGATAYTDEMAQDAVGGMVADTATIDITYTDATPELKADVKDGSITLAKQADLAQNTIIGRVTASTGVPEALTATQATSILNNMVGDSGAGGTKGLAPAPAAGDAAGGKFLKADGTWAAPAGGGDMTLAGVQSVTGLKTFDKDKIAMKGTSTGVTTISTANAGATDYTATLQAATGTIAYTSDITGTNSGTNTGDQTITLQGDVTGTGTGTFTATIANDAVTYAKMQNVSATDKVLGRTTAGAGDVEEIATTGSGNVVRATSATLVTPLLGTPTSGTLTNCTGLPIAGLTASTSTALGVGSIELGHATDTTITRTGAGAIAVEGTAVLLSGGALGTPSSGTLTNATGLPVAGITASTSTALGVGSIELGHASDTTIARVSAGVASIEGKNILTTDGGTLTGNITLGETTSIALDPAGSADGKYTGITITGTGGATIAFGDLVTLDKDDSRWELVDISVAAAATGDARGLLGIAVTSSSDGAALTVLLMGQIRADANFPALTIGAPVYASTTGDIVVSQPTTTDYVIRIVGYALTADEIMFLPAGTWTTHT